MTESEQLNLRMMAIEKASALPSVFTEKDLLEKAEKVYQWLISIK